MDSAFRLSSIPELSWCERLLNHGINDGKIACQFLWDGVAFSQVGDAGRTHLDLIIRALPDKDFKGQIKCEERRRNHQGRATFRIAKDQHMSLLHREADSSRFATVVNMGKEGQVSAVDGRLKAFQRLLDRKRTGSAHNALDRGRHSSFRWLVHGSHLSPVQTKDSGTT